MAQLNNELAERELLRKFRHENTWLQEVPAKNNWVGNNVIKIPTQGTAPEVLINNSSYPIDSGTRTDDYIARSLNKYDTKNTFVTEDELYALAYEKINDVQRQHREELEDKTAEHALWSIAPEGDSNNHPIKETTGDVISGVRKRLRTKDLIDLWEDLSKKNVPLGGRILVLAPEHAADLLAEDSGRERAWGNISDGLLTPNHVGFKLYIATYNPQYKKATSGTYDTKYERQAFGSSIVGAKAASICFYRNNTVKAAGTVQRFARFASEDPEYRQNSIGFRLWFGCFPMQDVGFAGIVSANPA